MIPRAIEFRLPWCIISGEVRGGEWRSVVVCCPGATTALKIGVSFSCFFPGRWQGVLVLFIQGMSRSVGDSASIMWGVFQHHPFFYAACGFQQQDSKELLILRGRGKIMIRSRPHSGPCLLAYEYVVVRQGIMQLICKTITSQAMPSLYRQKKNKSRDYNCRPSLATVCVVVLQYSVLLIVCSQLTTTCTHAMSSFTVKKNETSLPAAVRASTRMPHSLCAID